MNSVIESSAATVGLCSLQHALRLSGEEVDAGWVENPYWQYFCGFDYRLLELPIDPGSLARRRRRIGPDGIEGVLQETIAAARRTRRPRRKAWSG